MLQEDSNGEASFEIIDKRNEESLNNGDKTESVSSVSSAYSIPSPSIVSLPGGNLISNLPPPTNLPDFTLWQSQAVPAPSPLPQNLLPTTSPTQEPNAAAINIPFAPPAQFSAAIPPSKGIQHGLASQNIPDTSQSGGGLIGWMKEAVASGGILSKVAEKAKNSIDSVITTLDPQMSEFIYSGGDVEIAIVVQDLEDMGPIRDAIYAVFGKAWVSVIQSEDKSRSTTLDEGLKNAERRLETTSQTCKLPSVTLENILLKQNDSWFDLSVLLLKDFERNITVHTFTQTTPIPVEKFLKQANKDVPNISQYGDDTEKILYTYLQLNKDDWQQTVGNVPRKDVLTLASRVLMNVYKNKIAVNQ